MAGPAARRRPDDPALIEQAATAASAFADRAAVLVGGRVVLEGSREDLLASGDVVKHYLGIADAT